MVLGLLFQREAMSLAGMLICRDYTHSILGKQADRIKNKKGKANEQQGRED